MSHDYFVPSVLHRHRRPVRALLIDDQAWVVARDLGALTNCHSNDRLAEKLDRNQWRIATLPKPKGDFEQQWLISESAVCEVLRTNYYHPENRSLRQWFTSEVVPALRATTHPQLPRRRRVEWQGKEYGLMEWQGSAGCGWWMWRSCLGRRRLDTLWARIYSRWAASRPLLFRERIRSHAIEIQPPRHSQAPTANPRR
ncbi:BRO-N domain-containing protein [Metapseudomonas lalkuanensis]|uniref:phage antirepressor n=1 Tax=Metapseudomonas lalkuanensis TaxID=2604832 RepID=UPI0015B3B423|nr:phage antirepressor [Pseudomonas lalkuanensis]